MEAVTVQVLAAAINVVAHPNRADGAAALQVQQRGATQSPKLLLLQLYS
jgi:hypothetical protein